MGVHLLLECGGCDATATAGPIRRDPEAVTPEGWVMFDPWTQATYCPPCWAAILAAVEPAEVSA